MISNKDIIKGLKQAYQSIKVDPASIERNRAELLAYFKDNFPSQRKDLFFYFKPVLAIAAALFVFISGTVGVLAYASKTLPGDQLYVLKRLEEKIAYRLKSNEQKPVLRAELLVKRFEEVKSLVARNPIQDSEVPSVVKDAAAEFKKEVAAFKKELNPAQSEKINQGNLPVMDNKNILKVIANQDINQLLEDTKEALKENNLKIASAKMAELEKVFEEEKPEENDSTTIEQINLTSATSTLSLLGDKPEPKKENNLEINPIIPQPTNPDFKIEIKKDPEELFKNDLIKE